MPLQPCSSLHCATSITVRRYADRSTRFEAGQVENTSIDVRDVSSTMVPLPHSGILARCGDDRRRLHRLQCYLQLVDPAHPIAEESLAEIRVPVEEPLNDATPRPVGPSPGLAAFEEVLEADSDDAEARRRVVRIVVGAVVVERRRRKSPAMGRVSPGVDARIVWRSDQHPAVGTGYSPGLLHDREGVLEMLENVGEEDLVSAALRQRIGR